MAQSLFRVRNDFTGVRADVYKRGPDVYTVEVLGTKGEYVGGLTSDDEAGAIQYALLYS